MIDTLAWIHIMDCPVLGARSRGRLTVYLPGGKREPGESDTDAVLREIREVLSIALDPASLVAAGEFRAEADAKPAGVGVKLTCYEADFEGEIAPAAEIEEVFWLPHADRERCSAAGRLVLDHLPARDRIDSSRRTPGPGQKRTAYSAM